MVRSRPFEACRTVLHQKYDGSMLAVCASDRALVAVNLHKPAEGAPYSRSISAVCPQDEEQLKVVQCGLDLGCQVSATHVPLPTTPNNISIALHGTKSHGNAVHYLCVRIWWLRRREYARMPTYPPTYRMYVCMHLFTVYVSTS